MPTPRLANFLVEIQRARDMVGMGQSLGAMTHGRVDASDLYRAGLVHAVAAMDSYVHGVVLDGSVDIILGRRPAAPPMTKVGLNFSAVQALLGVSIADQESLARGLVAQRLSKETFQRPDDIAQGFASVGISKIWSTAFPRSSQATTSQLSLIVERRNQIVHQCDRDPLVPGAVFSITASDATDAIKFVLRVVRAIDSHC